MAFMLSSCVAIFTIAKPFELLPEGQPDAMCCRKSRPVVVQERLPTNSLRILRSLPAAAGPAARAVAPDHNTPEYAAAPLQTGSGLPRSSRTKIIRPSSAVPWNPDMAARAACDDLNRTIPNPRLRPSLPRFTSALTTQPTWLKCARSLSPDVAHAKLPTKTLRGRMDVSN